MTAAGQRRERVTFQQRGLDANGDRLGAWDAAGGFTRWARVKPLRGGEAVLQARLQGLAPVEIIVLADSETIDITSAWRAVWGGVSYALSAPQPSENRREITFAAQAGGSDA
jgi:head-tail adaptor